MEPDQSQSKSHGDSQQSGYPGFKSLSRVQHKKGAVPPRRSPRLQLHSIQSQRKPVISSKSSLPLPIFHQNIVASIIRRSKHKHFPHLVRELEAQTQQLADTGTGKTLEDSDEEWQSTCSTPSTPSSCDSGTEASEDTLSPSSETELFGLRAKSPSPSPSASEASSEASSSSSSSSERPSDAINTPSISFPSPSLSASYVPPSRVSSDDEYLSDG